MSEHHWARQPSLKTRGSVRRVAVNLSNIAEEAGLEGWSHVTRNEWGERPFYTGDAPRRIG